MTEHVYLLMFVNADNQKTAEAVFQGPDAEQRANEVVARKAALLEEDDDESYFVASLPVNPTNMELGFDPLLADFDKASIVRAAYWELMEKGEMHAPLWTNQSWLAHEVRAQFGIGVALSGRKLVKAFVDPAPGFGESLNADSGFVESQNA
jgi:hypothetical protein